MAKSSNNIIRFPIKPNFGSPTNIEEVENNIEFVKQFHIQETIETVIPFLFDRLNMAGFDLDDENDDDLRYGAFICEAIRSLLCSKCDMNHMFQIFAKSLFIEDEDGYLNLVENADINIKVSKDKDKKLD